MKVMIHGAINTSNYGDFLFAALFSSALKKNGIEVEFYSHPQYGISDFFAKNLGYTPDRRHYKAVMNSCDALVYMSGGYFLSHKKLTVEVRHTRRFLTPGQYFMKNGKPIYILGIGAGPFYKGLFSRIAKQILQYAVVVTVRNEESKRFCLDLGVNRDILVTADTALVLRDYIANDIIKTQGCSVEPGKKILLFHIDCNRHIRNKLKDIAVPEIKSFLKKRRDYELYLTSDGIMPDKLFDVYAKMFEPYSTHIIKYNDPWMLTQLIARADLIMTTKLHMGIVGTVYGRSVISFPWHLKTQRFYKQIGEGERCILLSEADEEKVSFQLGRFEGKQITIPEELKKKAKLNLELLPK